MVNPFLLRKYCIELNFSIFFPGCDWRQSKWSGSKCSYGHFDSFQICIYTRFVHTIQSSIFIFHRGKIHQNDFICRKSWKSQLNATIKIDFTKPCTVENPVQSASYRSMPWLVLGLVRSFLFCPGKSGFVVASICFLDLLIYRKNRMCVLNPHQVCFFRSETISSLSGAKRWLQRLKKEEITFLSPNAIKSYFSQMEIFTYSMWTVESYLIL